MKILDTHPYQIFDNDTLYLSPADHIKHACDYGAQMAAVKSKVVIAGEWTAAQTDCAKWLNGLGTGSRYEGTFKGFAKVGDGNCTGKAQGTVEALSQTDKDNLRAFAEAQIDAYEEAGGWFFWTWKTESAPEWNLKQLIANKLFPQPIDTDRLHGKQCGVSQPAG